MSSHFYLVLSRPEALVQEDGLGSYQSERVQGQIMEGEGIEGNGSNDTGTGVGEDFSIEKDPYDHNGDIFNEDGTDETADDYEAVDDDDRPDSLRSSADNFPTQHSTEHIEIQRCAKFTTLVLRYFNNLVFFSSSSLLDGGAVPPGYTPNRAQICPVNSSGDRCGSEGSDVGGFPRTVAAEGSSRVFDVDNPIPMTTPQSVAAPERSTPMSFSSANLSPMDQRIALQVGFNCLIQTMSRRNGFNHQVVRQIWGRCGDLPSAESLLGTMWDAAEAASHQMLYGNQCDEHVDASHSGCSLRSS